MKKTLLLVSLFMLPVFVFSQIGSDTITFEKNSNLVHIDTSQHPNIWQIGRPQKTFMDSAYSKPNAIITDTINRTPAHNTSSFIVGYVTDFAPPAGPFIQFMHKYKTDSLHAGGYIEVSTDTGKTWTNVGVVRPGLYYGDTITGGIPAFTGNSLGWRYCLFPLCYVFYNVGSDSALFRFTFKSDSVSTADEGWMIDNITITTTICEGIQEVGKDKGSIQIYPNPASTEVSLIYNFNSANHKAILNLYSPLGQLVKSEGISNNAGTITEDVSALPDGIYYYRLVVDGVPAATSKLVIIK